MQDELGRSVQRLPKGVRLKVRRPEPEHGLKAWRNGRGERHGQPGSANCAGFRAVAVPGVRFLLWAPSRTVRP